MQCPNGRHPTVIIQKSRVRSTISFRLCHHFPFASEIVSGRGFIRLVLGAWLVCSRFVWRKPAHIMRRSNRRTTCWGLFLFSSSAAVLLLLGLGSSSSSSLVEASSTRTGANRRAIRKTTKARQHHQQRNLQSGKGGKGGGSSGKGNSSGKDISNNAGLPSGMLATIGAIDAMNYGILQHQNNAKKSS